MTNKIIKQIIGVVLVEFKSWTKKAKAGQSTTKDFYHNINSFKNSPRLKMLLKNYRRTHRNLSTKI